MFENKLKPLKQENLTKRTITALKDLIISESLVEGFKLPSERILAEQLGVSRNIIREALKSLEANGILTKRHGKGTYITPFNSELVAKNIIFGLEVSEENFLEFLDYHELFEKFIINLSIERLDDGLLNELELIIDEMNASSIDLSGLIKLEDRFFKKILSVLKNIAIRRIGLITIDFYLLLNLEDYFKYAHLDPRKKNELINQYREIMDSLRKKIWIEP